MKITSVVVFLVVVASVVSAKEQCCKRYYNGENICFNNVQDGVPPPPNCGVRFEAQCSDDLCDTNTCRVCPDTVCVINNCGGCNTEFYLNLPEQGGFIRVDCTSSA